ncbi:MAG TPA: TadE/TadG family type IV pilus assembly protein [Acidimicrobiales bacterium]|nr:TadE/TadG family type IV pilus assembly protein [Acidimicrobiales bacterium]
MPRRDEGGQAAVELALALPLLALLALALLQVALVARDQVLLTHAAREAAREAAVAVDPGAARRGALAGSRLDADRLTVTTEGRDGVGSRVTARLAYRSPTDVPVIGRLVGDVRLRATVTMRVEMSTLRVTKP